MARTYKWLGGIGYILSFIPYVSVVSSILVAIAWIMMGKDTREKIFTVLGILLIVLFAAGIALAITMFASIFALLPMGAPAPGAIPFTRLGAFFGALIAAGVAILALAIAVFVVDIIAHFRAARIFDNKWFKLGGWFRIGAVIALAISIPLMAITILSMGLQGILSQMPPGGFPLGILFSILWPLIIVLILSLLATIFSIIAFFTIPEEAPQPESPGPTP